MKITRLWLWYIWPYWAVQFFVLTISTGPGKNIGWWWGFTIVFNALAFLLAWDVVRRRNKK